MKGNTRTGETFAKDYGYITNMSEEEVKNYVSNSPKYKVLCKRYGIKINSPDLKKTLLSRIDSLVKYFLL